MENVQAPLTPLVRESWKNWEFSPGKPAYYVCVSLVDTLLVNCQTMKPQFSQLYNYWLVSSLLDHIVCCTHQLGRIESRLLEYLCCTFFTRGLGPILYCTCNQYPAVKKVVFCVNDMIRWLMLIRYEESFTFVGETFSVFTLTVVIYTFFSVQHLLNWIFCG